MTKKLTLLLLALAALGCSPRSADPVDYVNPFIGTGFHGHTYPGATTPFGMVQLSPDTRAGNWTPAPATITATRRSTAFRIRT